MKAFNWIGALLTSNLVLGNAVLKDNSIDKVLKWLEMEGDREKEDTKTRPSTVNTGKLEQFITFTVMSEREINEEVQLETDQATTVLNVESCRGKLCRGGHGEFKIIYEGILQQKIAEFASQHPQEIPNIVLFSHFIPCYGNPRVQYSCAEELRNFIYAHGNTMKLIVGFRDVYNGTDKFKALPFMVADGITVFEKANEQFMNVLSLPYKIPQLPEGNRVLQDLFFKCLHLEDTSGVSALLSEFSNCKKCLGRNSKRIDEVLAYNVNMLTFRCTKDGNSVSARLGQGSKRILRKCFDQSIDSETGTDCPKCGNLNAIKNYKVFLKLCTSYAFYYSAYVGYLLDQYNPYSTQWVVKQMFCKDAYRHDFDSLSEQRPAVYCALPQLDVKNMCTKLKKRRDLEENFKTQIRDIHAASKKRLMPG